MTIEEMARMLWDIFDAHEECTGCPNWDDEEEECKIVLCPIWQKAKEMGWL